MPYKIFPLPTPPVLADMWDMLKNETRPIMVYGMGNGADKLFERFAQYGIQVKEVFASDGFVRGHFYRGYKVKSFSEIKENYPDFVIVLSFASNRPEVIDMLAEIDNSHDMLVPDMPVADTSEYFDKDFYNRHYDEIIKAYESLADEESKAVFSSVINYKLTGKMKYLLSVYSTRDEIYSLMPRNDIATVVDAGAYNGDTAREAKAYFPNLKRVFAIEPDKRNFKKLAKYSEAETDIDIIPINSAAWSDNGSGVFSESGNRNSTAVATASFEHCDGEISFVKIDSLTDLKIDYIKYDVEGAERRAIEGSQQVISRDYPCLLISLYHRSRDIFELVNLIKKDYPEYTLFLRRLRCLPAWEIDLICIKKRSRIRKDIKMNRPEILSPAGNFEKMKAAILYGADAVYLAGQIFGMRAAADNFSIPELASAVEYAHARGVKVYLTLNTMPREYEYELLRKYLLELSHINIDAMIIADVGVLTLVKELLPHMEIHISTQANATSAAACNAWHRLGAKRVVLARELTLDEIKAIRANIPDDLELECFVHGSMCVSYSGRCLLSNHIVGRDANRGMCAQPCRWNYTIKNYEIEEEKRPDCKMPVEEINGETFIMASRDTCTIEHIPELIEAGINSFKIEGRMKSAYYTAVVTNTYKMAVDSYFSGSYQYNPRWYRELESVSHRDYHTGYYFDDSHADANLAPNNGYIKDKAYLAVAVSYDKEKGIAAFTQRNKMCMGDPAELLTPGRTGRELVVGELFDENMNPIETTPHPYMKFYMKVDFEIKEGDILRAK